MCLCECVYIKLLNTNPLFLFLQISFNHSIDTSHNQHGISNHCKSFIIFTYNNLSSHKHCETLDVEMLGNITNITKSLVATEHYSMNVAKYIAATMHFDASNAKHLATTRCFNANVGKCLMTIRCFGVSIGKCMATTKCYFEHGVWYCYFQRIHVHR
jgi:hypothetical protein